MKLRFHVNQPEAIKRGFDCGSVVKIEVNIPDLSQKHRNIIADRFYKGSVLKEPFIDKPITEILLTIQEPTLNGVLETLYKLQ